MKVISKNFKKETTSIGSFVILKSTEEKRGSGSADPDTVQNVADRLLANFHDSLS